MQIMTAVPLAITSRGQSQLALVFFLVPNLAHGSRAASTFPNHIPLPTHTHAMATHAKPFVFGTKQRIPLILFSTTPVLVTAESLGRLWYRVQTKTMSAVDITVLKALVERKVRSIGT